MRRPRLTGLSQQLRGFGRARNLDDQHAKRFVAPVGPPVRNSSGAWDEHVRPDFFCVVTNLDDPSPFQDIKKHIDRRNMLLERFPRFQRDMNNLGMLRVVQPTRLDLMGILSEIGLSCIDHFHGSPPLALHCATFVRRHLSTARPTRPSIKTGI
ncbi:hypothetical protein NSPZN2_30663 [Nitrospira defluvii]|uniref:Uncharacterized protein n=1 Tax=Nitrospira defluvii TaxID=330214 RepID=A0ABM8RMP6_9BACT|nr:hypothetical protein NSPZN2_30663 [Nitrospira defluvii]